MEHLVKAIETSRPDISKQSVKTYLSILKNLYKKVFNNDELDLKRFKETDKFLNYLKDLEPKKRKTILSALVVITDDKAYRDQMLKDIEHYKVDTAKQEKTPEQEQSWVDTGDIMDLFNHLKVNATLLYKKKMLDMGDLQEIQNYIIIAILGGIFIPPRRSKDYVDFKIKNVNKDEDNYIQKNSLIFNSYKTSKTYSQQTISCPPELMKILKKWIKINPTEYLLFDRNGAKLTNVKMTQRLNKLFGKKASVNQMRHTYLSDKYQNTIKQNQEMAKDMADMGSSQAQQKIYIKKE